MIERKIGDKTIRLVRDDITLIDVEAFAHDIADEGRGGDNGRGTGNG